MRSFLNRIAELSGGDSIGWGPIGRLANGGVAVRQADRATRIGKIKQPAAVLADRLAVGAAVRRVGKDA